MYVLFWILASVAALVVAGFLYQCIGGHRDRLRFASPGRWIKIGRRSRLYLLEKGSGGPTVLFEAGIAATNLNWFHIQETVSRFTGTASYDRGGLGWSSPSRTARTPGNIAVELHEMLQRACIKPPYILVGHSFGGLVMRRYALLFPEDVAGIVLLDPMRCEEWPPLNPSKQSEIDRGRRLSGFAIPIARFGLARLAVTSLLCRSGKISGQPAPLAMAGAMSWTASKTKSEKCPGKSGPSSPLTGPVPAITSACAATLKPFPTLSAKCRTPNPSATSPSWF